jgi:hypothetical protein
LPWLDDPENLIVGAKTVLVFAPGAIEIQSA